MDLRHSPTYRLPDPPLDRTLAEQTWTSYRQGLAVLGSQPDGMERLNALLAVVSGQIETQARDLTSQTLSEYASNRDNPVSRSTRTVARSPDRSDPRQTPSRQPEPWELLSASRRLGPRLAQKLTLAESRRSSRAR